MTVKEPLPLTGEIYQLIAVNHTRNNPETTLLVRQQPGQVSKFPTSFESALPAGSYERLARISSSVGIPVLAKINLPSLPTTKTLRWITFPNNFTAP